MKIVTATHYFHPHKGGIEIVAQQHATRLADRGHEVKVISSGCGAEKRTQQKDGYSIHRYHAFNPLEQIGLPFPFPYPPSLRKTVKSVIDDDTDVIHAHGLNYLTTALLLRYSSSEVPVVLHQHTPFIDYSFPWSTIEWINDRIIGRYNLNEGNRVICVSDNIQSYVKELSAEVDPLLLLNGVDTQRYTPSNKQLRWTNTDEVIFFTLSRISYKKGIDVIIEAAHTLHRRGIDNVRIVIGGTGPDEKEVQHKAQELDNLEYIGYVDDSELPKYYASADCFVFASKTGEAFPTLTMLEALSSGTPLIASHLDKSSTPISDHQEALLIPPNDAEALTNSIVKLVNDPELRTDMSKKARETAVEQFEIENRIDFLEQEYSLLAE